MNNFIRQADRKEALNNELLMKIIGALSTVETKHD